MAIKYEVKKVVFGFDKSKTEKFVAQSKVLGMVCLLYTSKEEIFGTIFLSCHRKNG